MHVAIVSYEFPNETGGGGIGTYNLQLCNLLKEDHRVEVFAGSKVKADSYLEQGILVHRILVNDENDFKNQVVKSFSERHCIDAFNAIEAPDYGADALNIKKKFCEISLIVRLHGPKFIFNEFDDYHLNYIIKNNPFSSLKHHLSKVIQSVCKKKNNKIDDDDELQQIQLADHLVSPSRALAELVAKHWRLPHKQIKVLANPFVMNKSILKIKDERKSNVVNLLFVGKLTTLKGVYDLIESMKKILLLRSNIFLKIIGNYSLFSHTNKRMDNFLLSELQQFKDQVVLLGILPLEKVYIHIRKADIFIVPSLFENFPTVILEAMSLGKAIVATNVGGIPEIIENNTHGLLVPPKCPDKLSKAIIKLLNDPQLRSKLGRQSQERITKAFSLKTLKNSYLDFYSIVNKSSIENNKKK